MPGFFEYPNGSSDFTNMEKFWQNCLHQLELELPAQQYNLWVKPLTPLDYEDGVLRITAPNRFKLDWAKNQYSDRIAALATRHWKRPVEARFFLREKSDNPTSPMSDSQETAVVLPFAKEPETVPPLTEPQRHEQSGLNREMTFDSFVTGKANQLARAAAIQVANNPGVSYNPLYLFGGVGLGKTHLVHAIGNQIMQDRPEARIRYIHAEQYVRNVVTAYQRKSFDELKRHYHSLDVLLIDDIQFFVGKQRSQEEFFYTFEALIASRKQVIITSETFPKEIAGLEPRLISRFDAGLTVAIDPPELEMRVAILQRKAGTGGLQLADDVAFFVARHVRSNVRELEGALRSVLAYSHFHRQDITVGLAKEALKDLLSMQNRQISVENIQKTVADFYRIKVADMYSRKRPANIARPRQIAMYLTKELTQKSLPEIGELFGGRDHTTVLHAVRKITEERIKNPELDRNLRVLEQTLKG